MAIHANRADGAPRPAELRDPPRAHHTPRALSLPNWKWLSPLLLALLAFAGHAVADWDSPYDFSGVTDTPAAQPAPPPAPAAPLPAAKRIRVGVIDFDVKVPRAAGELGTGMTDMLISALDETGRYTVIDRETTLDVIGEQDFAQSGRMARASGPRSGRIKGVQLWIKGAVTEYGERTRDGGIGFGIGGIGLGLKKSESVVACDIRVIDAETGAVVETAHKRATVTNSGTSLGVSHGDVSMDLMGDVDSPLGQATREVIAQLVGFVQTTIDQHAITAKLPPWSGMVIKVMEDGRVVINGGTNQDLAPGQLLDVYRETEVFQDPVTGEVLGAERAPVGALRITEPREKFSFALPLDGAAVMSHDVVEERR